MLRSRDCYEPEVWEVEEEEQPEVIVEDLPGTFNDVLEMIFANLRDAEPDYWSIRGEQIC